MKRWLWIPVLLAGVCLMSRLPHPAVDVGKLEPVSVVRVDYREGHYHLSTDTGASGRGVTLTDAAEALNQGADRRVFLETAEYVLLSPEVPLNRELYRIFRPACRVCLAAQDVDLEAAAKYLTAHPPSMTLTQLRAGEQAWTWLSLEGDSTDGTT